MSLVKGRNGNKPRNRMHPNEARMQEDYYSSAYAKQQKEESEMASLSIQSPTKSQKETIMTEQTQQDQEVTITETVTKPTARRALPARQAKQQETTEEVIITPPPTDIPQQATTIPLIVDGETIEVIQLTAEEVIVEDKADVVATPQEEVDLVLEPTVLDEPEVPVVPEVRKRTIPETRGARQSMLPPKVEPTVKVVSEVPAGYVDAGDRYERKVEASLLGVTASVTMTKPKPGSGGMLIFEGRVDLHESEGVQFWRPVFSRNVTSDDEIPAHYLPAILAAVDWRNCGLTEPVKLVAINCRCAAQSNNAMDVSSDDDGTIITLLSA